MPHVPKAKKKASTKARGPRVNKSEWIRNQPATLPAKDVLTKAKAEGIKLSLAQIYTARSTAKKKAGSGPGRKPGRPPRVLPVSTGGATVGRREVADLRHEFVKIAMRIGTDEAQILLDRVIDVQTPSGRN